MRQLPIVKWEQEKGSFFFDERLRELRNVKNPNDRIKLNDFEVEFYKQQIKKTCKLCHNELNAEWDTPPYCLKCEDIVAEANEVKAELHLQEDYHGN